MVQKKKTQQFQPEGPVYSLDLNLKVKCEARIWRSSQKGRFYGDIKHGLQSCTPYLKYLEQRQPLEWVKFRGDLYWKIHHITHVIDHG